MKMVFYRAPAVGQWGQTGLEALGCRFDPSLAQRVKDPVLPQLWLRSHLQLGSDHWPRSPICPKAAKTEKKKRKKEKKRNKENDILPL